MIKFPRKFRSLFEDWRYKVYYGGRAGLKSWQFARALLIHGASRACRIVCAREVLKSIDDSVHDLLCQQIKILGEDDPRIAKNYTPRTSKIISNNGTDFSYIGLWANLNNFKSYNNGDYLWCEEAENNSQKSWDIVTPTFRKTVCKCHYQPVELPGDRDENGELKIFCKVSGKQLRNSKEELWKSEIWISFNPARDDDPTYDMFINQTQPDSVVVETNYRDNKWFGLSPNKDEMEMMKKTNYSKYLNVWEGQPLTNYDTLVFRSDTAVNTVKHDTPWIEGFETWTGWDFGVADDTAIPFFQIIPHYPDDEFPLGFEVRVFDEYVNNNKPASHYREVVDSKGYLIDTHACDPSGANRDASLSSWVDKLKTNPKNGRIDYHFQYTHKYGISEMIDATNDIMHAIRYNPQKVPHFHKMLRRWQYRTDRDGRKILPLKPEHDEYSHMGTAFYYFVINRFPPKKRHSISNR